MTSKNCKMAIVSAIVLILWLSCICYTGSIEGNSQTNVITYVPRSMTYQGILKDADGEGIPDSFFDVTFRIFDAETDGNQEWTESFIGVGTDGEGRFTVTFTSVDLGFDKDYWLEMEIDSEVLAPRQKFNMAPFAGASVLADYAWDANTLDGYNSEDFAAAIHSHSEAAGWVDNGPEITLETSTDEVGIGTMSPQAKLDVASSGGPWGAVYGHNTGNNNYGYLGGMDYGVLGSGSEVGVYGIHPASGNFGMIGSEFYGVYGHSDDGQAGYFYGDVQITNDLSVFNNVTVSTQVTANALDIASFRMNNGVTSGYVLTTDASGYGTWQPAGGGVQGGGTTNYLSKFTGTTTIGNSLIYDNGTNVGIGTTSPSSKLDVNGDIRSRSGLIVDNSASIGDAIDANRIIISQFRLIPGSSSGYLLTSDASGNGTWQPLNAIGGSGTANYIPKFNSINSVTASIIYDNGTNIGIGTTSPSAKLDVNGASWLRGNVIVDGHASIGGNVDAGKVITSLFQKMGGASAGYVLTSDASGNGTWQPLPSSVTAETVSRLESKLNEMAGIIEAQNTRIEQLENQLANLEKNR
jgi:cytoskeletal protein CcmA (bactofilin family)